MNEKQQIFEIIDGFKNLTSRIKKDNDEIKDSMKNKDLTIAACKKEYKKLYAEHEELKRKYVELEKYFHQEKYEKRQNRKREQEKQHDVLYLIMMMMMMIMMLTMSFIMKMKTIMIMITMRNLKL